MIIPRHIFTLLFALITLAGCSSLEKLWGGGNNEKPLPGDRVSILEFSDALELSDDTLESADAMIMPPPWKNEFWPQFGGYPNHAMQNLLLSESALRRVWKTDIGDGATRELPLTAQPVVVDGEIFTLDTEGQLSAFSIENGRLVWRTDVGNEQDDDPVIGGGIAYSGGVLYVTNGYKEVLAVHPAKGNIIWRKAISGPSRAAPTIMDGRLFVTTLDNKLLALNATDGSLLWDYESVGENAGLVGAASPAANRNIVLPAFSSGDIVALRVQNGSMAWADNLSAVKHYGGLASLSDIKAAPVLDKGIAFAVSFGGRLVAIDERTGSRIWQREIGSTSMPWVAGNHVFLVTSENEIVALTRETGLIKWVTRIQNNTDQPVYFTGPILAGGRLFTVGSNGFIVEAEPETGRIIRQWDTEDPISIAPIIAGGVLYILSDDGTLSAYR